MSWKSSLFVSSNRPRGWGQFSIPKPTNAVANVLKLKCLRDRCLLHGLYRLRFVLHTR